MNSQWHREDNIVTYISQILHRCRKIFFRKNSFWRKCLEYEYLENYKVEINCFRTNKGCVRIFKIEGSKGVCRWTKNILHFWRTKMLGIFANSNEIAKIKPQIEWNVVLHVFVYITHKLWKLPGTKFINIVY